MMYIGSFHEKSLFVYASVFFLFEETLIRDSSNSNPLFYASTIAGERENIQIHGNAKYMPF